MNPANWLLTLLRQLFVDALFKRPISVNLTRSADGAFDLKTNINPSGQQPIQQQPPPYYGGYPPYGYPPGWPAQPLPPGHVRQPGPAAPPATQPPTPSTDNFPEEYEA